MFLILLCLGSIISSSMDSKAGGNSKKKWALKTPFSSNKLHFFKYFEESEEAAGYISKTVMPRMFENKRPASYEVPYLMIQERVSDNKEAKLCFLNKKFSHFCSGD